MSQRPGLLWHQVWNSFWSLKKPASVRANFVELRRITSELADVEAALAVAEDAWLALEERAP